jgi:3-deoxy-7-phosphoheptulonate synthase
LRFALGEIEPGGKTDSKYRRHDGYDKVVLVFHGFLTREANQTRIREGDRGKIDFRGSRGFHRLALGEKESRSQTSGEYRRHDHRNQVTLVPHGFVTTILDAKNPSRVTGQTKRDRPETNNLPELIHRSGPILMLHSTEDLRVQAIRPLLPPAILHEEMPLTSMAADLVWSARKDIEACLAGEDPRLVVVIGPCSIHDPKAALEYAGRLKSLADRYSDQLLVVMRCYFEKPRTTVGWKGLINDPRMDGSFRINDGLRLARRFLSDIAALQLPAATEFLDTTVPQHIADLISWGAIGARTTESQTHRELASGLSMPIGFKNATDGNIQVAIDAMKAASQPHWFPGTTKDGMSAIVQTTGNASCHVVLRGGTSGPNYAEEHVRHTHQLLEKQKLPSRIMVDFSHANSSKDHVRQLLVAEDVAGQRAKGDSPIFSVMIESFLVEGRQDVKEGAELTYGQSVTDACIGWEQTEKVLAILAD